MTIQNDIHTEQDAEILAQDIIHILKTLKEPIRVVWGTIGAMEYEEPKQEPKITQIDWDLEAD